MVNVASADAKFFETCCTAAQLALKFSEKNVPLRATIYRRKLLMPKLSRPLRSVLYIPGSKPRALDKARSLACDAIIFDLEDAVTPDEKVAARATLAEALAEGGYGQRYRVIRINGLDTEWGQDDALAAAATGADAILLPKVNSPADLDAVAALVGDKPLWAMMETPAGMLNAAAIAAHRVLHQGDRVGGIVFADAAVSEHRPQRRPAAWPSGGEFGRCSAPAAPRDHGDRDHPNSKQCVPRQRFA